MANTDKSLPAVGEIWVADLGMAAKRRPVLVLAVPEEVDARVLVIVAPLTSQIRGMRGEIPLEPIRWLSKPSAVNIQGLASIGRHVLERRLGKLDKVPMEKVRAALRELLNL